MQPVACEDCILKRITLYRRLQPASQGRVINHVIVHQGGGMQILQGRGQGVEIRIISTAAARAQHQEERTYPFAAAEERVLDHLAQ